MEGFIESLFEEEDVEDCASGTFAVWLPGTMTFK
jgi:hypothetical protein